MIWLAFIIAMGVIHRLTGTGFGDKWGIAWLPELLFALPFGVFGAWAAFQLGSGALTALALYPVCWAISYAGTQSATWAFLRWESHTDPNMERSYTLKPAVDWLASRWGYKLGDEGYAWVAAFVKGFVIGLPAGGFLPGILFALGHEAGTHTDKFASDPHLWREFLSGCGAATALMIMVKLLTLGV